MNKKLQDRLTIESIMANFDFFKVHQVMYTLNWCWANSVVADQPPSIKQLRQEARRLLGNLLACPKLYLTGSGGFYAVRQGADITLAFVLEEVGTDSF